MNEDRGRSELEAVLASTLFTRAPDLSKILKYVCERRFTNQTDAIKEYNIALEALGRGPVFSWTPLCGGVHNSTQYIISPIASRPKWKLSVFPTEAERRGHSLKQSKERVGLGHEAHL